MFLKLDHLKKLYDADNGVKELNFSIDKGEFVTLLGPSGAMRRRMSSGRTTTVLPPSRKSLDLPTKVAT